LELEEEELQAELDELGDVHLFSGRSLSLNTIHARGVEPAEWRWTIHRAETMVRQSDKPSELENVFLQTVVSLCKGYAVARYARHEGITLASAKTATYDHGIRALLYSFIAGEPLLSHPDCRNVVQKAFYEALKRDNLVSYQRTGLMRSCFYRLASDSHCEKSGFDLGKNGMKEILSLLRLFFASVECQVKSPLQLSELNKLYASIRGGGNILPDIGLPKSKKRIRNWDQRSLHPLFFYFPIVARHSLARFEYQSTFCQENIEREHVVNEIALVICGLHLLRKYRWSWVRLDG